LKEIKSFPFACKKALVSEKKGAFTILHLDYDHRPDQGTWDCVSRSTTVHRRTITHAGGLKLLAARKPEDLNAFIEVCSVMEACYLKLGVGVIRELVLLACQDGKYLSMRDAFRNMTIIGRPTRTFGATSEQQRCRKCTQ